MPLKKSLQEFLGRVTANKLQLAAALALSFFAAFFCLAASLNKASAFLTGAPAALPSPAQFPQAAETSLIPDQEPDPLQTTWNEISGELEDAARHYHSRVAIYLKDLRHNREWAYHADDLFPSASLIKVPVMIGVFEKIHRGELSLDTQLALRRSVRMGGSGSLKWRRDGTRFPVRQLLDRMIQESDNTAMRILIDEVGMDFLQKQFPKMGLLYTEIFPDGLTLKSGRVKYENYTTAREISMLLDKIYQGEMVDKLSSEMMLEILKRRRPRSRLSKGLPMGWEIAHKTGLLRGACHDSAIIFAPEGEYILTVLTGQNPSYSSAKKFITRIGRITYRHFKSDFSLYARASSSQNSSSSANR